MRKFVLDTNIIMAYVRKSKPFLEAERQFGLTADDAQLIVSVVTLGEIRVLASRNGWGEEKTEALNRFFEETLLIVDISAGAPELLEAYVEIDCFSKGRSMGKNDLWIAATAKATGSTLVTADKDFDHLGSRFFSVARIDAE
jgi:tRNA(fMet)-specific endonuclease VapC